jgi:hypothetical protein
MVLFNAQLASKQTYSSDQGVIDMNNLYSDLMNFPGGQPHAIAFTNETLTPGVYDSAGALTITGTITLDGLGQADPLFIIRGPGAFTTAVNTEIRLINGANANNVFWVATGAITTGAPTIMKGTLFSSSTVALGANTQIEGRMFSRTAALSMGVGSVVLAPGGESNINLGVLSSFVMFTASGAISGSCYGCITGDVGTGLGAATAFTGINGIVYLPGSEASDPGATTYAIYQNGVEVVHSSREINLLRSVVNLQAFITVTSENNPIEIRWKVDEGEAKLINRTLSLIRSHY